MWLVALVLALGATAVAVLSADARWLRLGVVAALWAALIGAFVASRYRRQAVERENEAEELRSVYELELEREVAARREYELEVEAETRRRVEAEAKDELAALRDELRTLRENLEVLLGGEVLVERFALRAESTRMRSLPEQARMLALGDDRRRSLPVAGAGGGARPSVPRGATVVQEDSGRAEPRDAATQLVGRRTMEAPREAAARQAPFGEPPRETGRGTRTRMEPHRAQSPRPEPPVGPSERSQPEGGRWAGPAHGGPGNRPAAFGHREPSAAQGEPAMERTRMIRNEAARPVAEPPRREPGGSTRQGGTLRRIDPSGGATPQGARAVGDDEAPRTSQRPMPTGPAGPTAPAARPTPTTGGGGRRHRAEDPVQSPTWSGLDQPAPSHTTGGRRSRPEEDGSGAHAAGRSVTELLAAHGLSETPRRRRRRDD
ncbi:MAG TPA: DUF6779 domain-containing protein [Pseudonocardiaceae bacterium]